MPEPWTGKNRVYTFTAENFLRLLEESPAAAKAGRTMNPANPEPGYHLGVPRSFCEGRRYGSRTVSIDEGRPRGHAQGVRHRRTLRRRARLRPGRRSAPDPS